MKCRNCKNNTLLDDGVQFSWCEIRHDNLDIDEERFCGAFSQATNADRIRSMTDEELGFLIAWNSYETPPWCREHEECPFIGLDHVPCEECALDWLKEEATE